MVNVTCKLVWIRELLIELGFAPMYPMRLYTNNQVVHIAENLVFHKHTKHVEMNYHLVKIVQTEHVSSGH